MELVERHEVLIRWVLLYIAITLFLIWATTGWAAVYPGHKTTIEYNLFSTSEVDVTFGWERAEPWER